MTLDVLRQSAEELKPGQKIKPFENVPFVEGMPELKGKGRYLQGFGELSFSASFSDIPATVSTQLIETISPAPEGEIDGNAVFRMKIRPDSLALKNGDLKALLIRFNDKYEIVAGAQSLIGHLAIDGSEITVDRWHRREALEQKKEKKEKVPPTALILRKHEIPQFGIEIRGKK